MTLIAFIVSLLILYPIVVKLFRISVRIDEGEFKGYPLPPICHFFLLCATALIALFISAFFW